MMYRPVSTVNFSPQPNHPQQAQTFFKNPIKTPPTKSRKAWFFSISSLISKKALDCILTVSKVVAYCISILTPNHTPILTLCR
jgi:hypothetical protein